MIQVTARRSAISGRTQGRITAKTLRSVHVASAILAGVAVGLLLGRGEWLAVVLALVGAALLGAVVRRSTDVRDITAVMSLAFASRLAVLAILDALLTWRGTAGTLGIDDYAYQDLAWRIAEHWRGGEVFIGWIRESHLLGPWVYAQAGLFWLVGAQFAAVKVFTAICGCVAGLVAYQVAHAHFGRRAAMIAAACVLFAPGPFFWSLFNFRDVPVSATALAALWASRAVAGRRDAIRFAAFLVAIALTTALRSATGVILAATALTGPHSRLHGRVAAGALVLGAIIVGGGLVPGVPSVAEWAQLLEWRREFSARGARSALVEPARIAFPPQMVRPGERYLVWPIDLEDRERRLAGPYPSPDLTPSGRTLAAAPGDTIELEWEGALSTSVVARARDVVVIIGAVPDTQGPPAVLLLGGGSDPPQFYRRQLIAAPGPADLWREMVQSIAFLPRGLLNAVAAPWPWMATTALDGAAVVDTAIWYVALTCAVVVILRRRAPGYLVAYGAGVLLLQALSEGNVGTLVRHRAMVEPVVLVVAAPLLLYLSEVATSVARAIDRWWQRRWPTTR